MDRIGCIISHLYHDFFVWHICFSRNIISSTITRLNTFVDFIIADLQIQTTGVFNHCRVRFIYHIDAVLFICNLQANSKARVAHNLRINDTAWLLCRKNQMYSEATTNLSYVDELCQKLRLLCL